MPSLPHIEIRDLKPGEERFFDLHGEHIREVNWHEAWHPSTENGRYLRVSAVPGQGIVYHAPRPYRMRHHEQIADVQTTLEYTVRHGGQEYVFWLPQKALDVTYDEQKIVRSGQLEHLRNYYTCRGGHLGPDIQVYIQNPRPETSDGFYIESDGVFWADTDTEVEALILDTYIDAICDQEKNR